MIYFGAGARVKGRGKRELDSRVLHLLLKVKLIILKMVIDGESTDKKQLKIAHIQGIIIYVVLST